MHKVIARTVVVNDAGEVLFLRRSDDDEDRPGGWDFPGGGLDEGEEPRQAAIREAHEEVGLELVDPLLVYGINTVKPNGEIHTWLAFIEFVSGRPAVTLSHEHSKYMWMTPEDAFRVNDYELHHQVLGYLQAHDVLNPKSKDKAFTTCRVLLQNASGQILLARRSPTDPFYPGTWDIPGGRCDPGEGQIAAVIRETKEEVGVTIRNPRLVYAISAPRPQGSGTWLFYAANSNDEPKVGSEHDALKWITFDDLPKYTDYDILTRMHTFIAEHGVLD